MLVHLSVAIHWAHRRRLRQATNTSPSLSRLGPGSVGARQIHYVAMCRAYPPGFTRRQSRRPMDWPSGPSWRRARPMAASTIASLQSTSLPGPSGPVRSFRDVEALVRASLSPRRPCLGRLSGVRDSCRVASTVADFHPLLGSAGLAGRSAALQAGIRLPSTPFTGTQPDTSGCLQSLAAIPWLPPVGTRALHGPGTS